MPRGALFGERDQAISNFAATLGRLCDVLPAHAAALVDSEGETVDYSGRLTPYDTRVVAAEWQLVVSGLKDGDHNLTPPLEELLVRAGRASFAAFNITEGYSLVQEDDQARPISVWLDQSWMPAVVIGRFSQPDAILDERGYRVMLEDGNELTLVRERLGRWYREGDL
jgi:hypothetical protein